MNGLNKHQVEFLKKLKQIIAAKEKQLLARCKVLLNAHETHMSKALKKQNKNLDCIEVIISLHYKSHDHAIFMCKIFAEIVLIKDLPLALMRIGLNMAFLT